NRSPRTSIQSASNARHERPSKLRAAQDELAVDAGAAGVNVMPSEPDEVKVARGPQQGADDLHAADLQRTGNASAIQLTQGGDARVRSEDRFGLIMIGRVDAAALRHRAQRCDLVALSVSHLRQFRRPRRVGFARSPATKTNRSRMTLPSTTALASRAGL